MALAASTDGNKLVRKNRVRPGDEFAVPSISADSESRRQEEDLKRERIQLAIQRGIQSLRSHPWEQPNHPVGYIALGGLTLLECGVPATDPMVKNSAIYVRNHAMANRSNYEVSLAVLFLDRLGSPGDRALIQALGLRLVAGQSDSGGWSYDCPRLNPGELYSLLRHLQTTRPLPRLLASPSGSPTMLGSAPVSGAVPLATPRGTPPAAMPAPQDLKDVPLENPFDGIAGAGNAGGRPMGEGPRGGREQGKGKGLRPAPAGPRPSLPELAHLPPAVQQVAVVQQKLREKGQFQLGNQQSDNSNTQFALLALWAARRHDVPTDRALLMAHQRFLQSQTGDGAWGYHHQRGGNGTPAMTGVGLLGLAIGHGIQPDILGGQADPKVRPALLDPAVIKGLKAFGRSIGEAPRADVRSSMQNLYFLWTVERVAMLYDLNQIEGKDWYGWGAAALLDNQAADGSWQGPRYPGSDAHLDTCFALLFLRRSNLVTDLTQHLKLPVAIREVPPQP